ncbi:hypothetical protein D5018_15110 [Parashewanella curva]|uniref:Uncharacterized protein n=1 Tax=Parashewanella curva TaxID=2338552 RepID=A0A3L8PVS0_9GAMM|nr:WVD2 family protein [Parashewanella curva]RLV58879.1 hypothetical protein D5018_15110 [Parashewanella curva]
MSVASSPTTTTSTTPPPESKKPVLIKMGNTTESFEYPTSEKDKSDIQNSAKSASIIDELPGHFLGTVALGTATFIVLGPAAIPAVVGSNVVATFFDVAAEKALGEEAAQSSIGKAGRFVIRLIPMTAGGGILTNIAQQGVTKTFISLLSSYIGSEAGSWLAQSLLANAKIEKNSFPYLVVDSSCRLLGGVTGGLLAKDAMNLVDGATGQQVPRPVSRRSGEDNNATSDSRTTPNTSETNSAPTEPPINQNGSQNCSEFSQVRNDGYGVLNYSAQTGRTFRVLDGNCKVLISGPQHDSSGHTIYVFKNETRCQIPRNCTDGQSQIHQGVYIPAKEQDCDPVPSTPVDPFEPDVEECFDGDPNFNPSKTNCEPTLSPTLTKKFCQVVETITSASSISNLANANRLSRPVSTKMLENIRTSPAVTTMLSSLLKSPNSTVFLLPMEPSNPPNGIGTVPTYVLGIVVAGVLACTCLITATGITIACKVKRSKEGSSNLPVAFDNERGRVHLQALSINDEDLERELYLKLREEHKRLEAKEQDEEEQRRLEKEQEVEDSKFSTPSASPRLSRASSLSFSDLPISTAETPITVEPELHQQPPVSPQVSPKLSRTFSTSSSELPTLTAAATAVNAKVTQDQQSKLSPVTQKEIEAQLPPSDFDIPHIEEPDSEGELLPPPDYETLNNSCYALTAFRD